MSNFNVDFCCTCLRICTGNEKLVNLGLETSQEVTYRNKLKSCVPEMILQNTEDCFLCGSCSEALEISYNFRNMCLITEKKLQEYRVLQQRSLKDISSVREDLLQVLSKELKDLDGENPAITAAKELGSLLTETLDIQESNTLSRTLSSRTPSSRKLSSRTLPSRAPSTRVRLSRKRKLSDDELIKKACNTLPELRNIPATAFKCQVSLEKIVVNESPVIIPSDKKKDKYYCSICDKIVKRKERFYSHMLRHSNIKAYKCEDCKASYFSADSLRYHRKRAHPDEVAVEDNRGKITKNVPKVKPITIKVTGKKKVDAKKKPVPETKCILKIKLPKKIKKTMVKNPLSDKNFYCNYCDYTTTAKHLLDRHVIKHSGGRNYLCALCPKAYFVQWELDRHIRTHHKISEPPKKKSKLKMPEPIQIKQEVIDYDEEIVCTICSERFNSEPEYKTHLKTHTEPSSKTSKKKKKKFFCPVCKVEFSSRDHANIHTGAKPYTCNTCNKTFGAYTSLRKHRYTHAKESQKQLVTQSSKKHVCEICKKEFQKASELCSHNCQTPSGESVYRCQICRNAYLGRTALIDHMKLHVAQNGN